MATNMNLYGPGPSLHGFQQNLNRSGSNGLITACSWQRIHFPTSWYSRSYRLGRVIFGCLPLLSTDYHLHAVDTGRRRSIWLEYANLRPEGDQQQVDLSEIGYPGRQCNTPVGLGVNALTLPAPLGHGALRTPPDRRGRQRRSR